MTVNTTSITSGPYTGNGVTTDFAYGFRVQLNTQLKVYLTPAAGGDPVLQTLTTHYTVSDVGEDAGGNVQFVTAPASGETVYIRANYDSLQSTDLNSQGAFFPDLHEDAFDKLAFRDQQMEDLIGRCASLNENYSGSFDPELPTPVADRYLHSKADGSGFEWTSGNVADLTTPGAIGSDTPNTGAFTTLTATTFQGRPASQVGAREILETIAVNGQTNIDIDLSSHVDYFQRFEIHFSYVNPGTDGAILSMQVSDDAGATFYSATQYSSHQRIHDTASTTSTDYSTTAGGSFLLFNNVGNVTGNEVGICGEVVIDNPHVFMNTIVRFNGAWRNNAGAMLFSAGAGIHDSDILVDALRFSWSSGVFGVSGYNGTISVYGIR